ncbi:MAG: hypothetical protein R3B72_51715 [Polyangiaceae bacterium]
MTTKERAPAHAGYLDYCGPHTAPLWNVVSDPGDLEAYEDGSSLLGLPIPSTAMAVAIRAEPENETLVQRTLSSATATSYLSIPPRSACLLTKLPPSTRTLQVDGEHVAQFNKTAIFPQIERLIGMRMRFTAQQFPSLRHLDIEVDKPSVKTVASIRNLETINLVRCKDNGILDRIFPDRLGFIGIRGWHPNDFRSLVRFPRMRGIWIQEPRSPLDLAQLLPAADRIFELTLAYCSNIANLGKLLEFSSLTFLQLIGCGSVGIDSFRSKLIQRGVLVEASGTR